MTLMHEWLIRVSLVAD